MNIKEMFLKDIERDIRGVIKVAQTDDENIYQELDEYVVTRELNKHLSKFYENYQKGIDGETDKMGVWISGFFGSGKSHFLKILAYLLENKKIKDKQAIDFFKDKIQDPLILANMNRTANTETEVILFNIDSKASVNSKSKENAILSVFMKVFYEHRGYFGDIPGVAEMEKYLDQKGIYEKFKSEFKNLAGEEWHERRNSFYFDADYVIGALTKVTNMSEESARSWFNNGVHNIEISIEKFAKDVNEYIGQKGENFHLVFLVDEIGQFIGDSSSLMLNLQTLTEDLGTYCQGRVWIMVTSQESMESILTNKVKDRADDDFSRIQGRFDTRLSLSSISVDEVLKKRILQKKDYVNDKLKLIYLQKRATLKNLICFKDSTADLRGYNDEQEFADVYPFIPYQFKLLQNVFEQVRRHGSSGKSLSEGERSMLSAFRESVIAYKNSEEGALIPFYAFYDTIKEFLNPTISRVIDGAYLNPELNDDEFNINLLKVLFMIKYIKELPANIDNIAILMLTNIDEKKSELIKKIEVSLRKLISQTLVEKNGTVFIFLTDDEQDINREIKTINIDEDALKQELADYVFNDLYAEKKFRYSPVYSFSFNQKMDERNFGNQTADIGVNIISPLSDFYGKSESELMMLTSGSSECIIKLGGNDSYIEEMEEVLKIEEFSKKKNTTQLSESIQNILLSKQSEVRERRRRVLELLEDAIKSGQFFINGDNVSIKGSTVREKINTALHALVDNVYTNLGDMKDFLNMDKDLLTILNTKEEQLSLSTDMKQIPNEVAIREIINYINFQDLAQKQIRVKMILDRFHNKPFGWRELDIQGIIAELLKTQQIRIRYNSEYLDPEIDAVKIVTILTKPAEADRGIILKRKKVDETLIKIAKKLCKEVFNTTDLPEDEDGLVKAIRMLFEKQVNEIIEYKAHYKDRKYPGLSLLEKGLEYFSEFHKGLDNASFFEKMKELQKELIYWEEDMTYLKSFFSTEQKEIFDKGLKAVLKYEENKSYLIGCDIEEYAKQLTDIVTDTVPYGKIQLIPELIKKIEDQLLFVLTEKKDSARNKVKNDFNFLLLKANQDGVPDEIKEKVEQYYPTLLNQIDMFVDIYKVDATISQSASFKENYERMVNKEIQKWQERKKIDTPISLDSVNDKVELVVTVQKEQIKASELIIVKELRTEEEVDQYINTISNKLKQIIKLNKKIEFIE